MSDDTGLFTLHSEPLLVRRVKEDRFAAGDVMAARGGGMMHRCTQECLGVPRD